MTKPPADRPDVTMQLLINLAASVLEHYLSDAPEIGLFADTVQHPGAGRRRRAATGPVTLESWSGPGDSVVHLHLLPDRKTYLVELKSAKLHATVRTGYDHDEESLDRPVVEEVSGNKASIRRLARALIDEIEDALTDTDIMTMMSELGGAPGAAGRASAEGEDEETVVAGAIARTLAALIRFGGTPELTDSQEGWFDGHPEALWPLLDQLREVLQTEPRDEALVQAYLLLLVQQLELIRFRQERGWDWAAALLAEYQQRLAALHGAGTLSDEDWLTLAGTLHHAKLPASPAMKQALSQIGPPADGPPPGQESEALAALIDQMAGMLQRPFEVIAAMSDIAGLAPSAARELMVQALVRSRHQVMRDVVPLMLLDQDADVRRAVAATLEQAATPESMSPEALRRIIAVRNWLPPAERPAVDRVVRAARTKGVACAQWPTAVDPMFVASPMDGAGAQSLLAVSRGKAKGVIAAVLFKQGFGIRDCWCDHASPRREINAAVRHLTDDTGASQIDRMFCDRLIQLGIAQGVAVGRVPDPALLELAEVVGGSDWQDRGYDLMTETQALFDQLPSVTRDAKGVAASLARSARWAGHDPIAETWLEDGPLVHEAMDRPSPAKDDATAAQRVLAAVLPQSRLTWAERFLLLAWWSQAAKSNAVRARWPDFAVLAHELAGDRPLSEIGLMVAIAERSVLAARSERW